MGRPKKNTENDTGVLINIENEQSIENDEYIVIERDNLIDLLLGVCNHIHIGYICQGGVSVVSWQGLNGREFLYSQAMVKRE